MSRNCLLLVLVCFLPLSCRNASPPESRIELLERVPYSTPLSDTRVIVFGTSETQPMLVSGWADPETSGGKPFQWVISEKAELVVETAIADPLFLHISAHSFFVNHADVYLNEQLQGQIEIGPETETVMIPLKSAQPGKNHLEFRFAELRSPEGGKDPRTLAAAFYSMVLTPSKYMPEPLAEWTPGEFGVEGHYRRGSKEVPAYYCRTGGSLRFQSEVRTDAVLEFGYLFQPTVFSESDDFAMFSIVLRRDGHPEQKLLEDRMTDRAVRFKRILLQEYLSGSSEDLIEIELRVVRNTLDEGKVAWIQPVLLGAITDRNPDTHPVRSELRARNANVLIVVLDAAAAGHFGCYGYDRNTTPIADKLAADHILFEHAYTNAVYTLASTGALLTGLLPERHRILDLKDRLPKSTTTMATILHEAGYQTGTFVANGNASSSFGMTLGFDTAKEVFRGENYTGWAQEVTDAFRSWFHERGKWKWFAYLHYREPHDPYNPPEEWVRKFVDPAYRGPIGRDFTSRIRIATNEKDLTEQDRNQIRDLYDANLAYADSQIGLLLKELRNHGQLDNTIVIVTADHGEAFWQHGYQGHNVQLYQESIHIPLIAKVPDRLAMKGRKVSIPVCTVDILPTLVDLLGLSRKGMDFDGESFLPFLSAGTDRDRPIFSQTTRQRAYSVLQGNYKYMTDLIYGGEELYNLQKDPSEMKNLITMEPVRARYYRYLILRQIAISRKPSGMRRPEKAVIDSEARENLKALGYIDD